MVCMKSWKSALLLSPALLFSKEDASLNQHISFYADALYMRRYGVDKKTLVEDSLTTKNVIHKFKFEPGYRVGMGIHPNRNSSFEGSYLNMKEWHGRKHRTGNGTLTYPFKNAAFAPGFRHADRVVARYLSRFSTADANYWRHITPKWVDSYAYAWIWGLRGVSLKEKFFLTYHKNLNVGRYNTRTRNILFGPQLGLSLDWNPLDYLTWTVTAKVGPMANRIRQRVDLTDQGGALVVRHSSKQKWKATFLADASLALAFHVGGYFELHVGYQLLFLQGVALAPEQLSQSTSPKNHIVSHGKVFMQGAFAGLGIGF